MLSLEWMCLESPPLHVPLVGRAHQQPLAASPTVAAMLHTSSRAAHPKLPVPFRRTLLALWIGRTARMFSPVRAARCPVVLAFPGILRRPHVPRGTQTRRRCSNGLFRAASFPVRTLWPRSATPRRSSCVQQTTVETRCRDVLRIGMMLAGARIPSQVAGSWSLVLRLVLGEAVELGRNPLMPSRCFVSTISRTASRFFPGTTALSAVARIIPAPRP
mmetsp:Transcript_5606/g.13201  ORF Transcript_5606/g.13201 Transcript_5606/m.13201 type:complete len:217 (+) Transcript_5606:380-1030(+)